ncbi:MAG: 6-carboxytetrahydropterin synthase [Holophagales bacterium]|nr:6-carboxytetrahydropterin synthase [Holophagales bacterium]
MMLKIRAGGNVRSASLESGSMLLLSRTIHFNAAHRLFRRDRSDEWNRQTYGAASNLAGYGHNYALEVSVAGEPDPENGMVINLHDLDRVLKEEVDRPLDHRNLNEEIPEFQDTIPTAENLARWIWDHVAARLAREAWPCRLAALTLTLTPGFRVELKD